MKKLIVGLSLIFLTCTPCFAQHTDVYIVDDFSKMLQSQVSPYLLPANAATEARNVRANDVYGSLAKRPEMLDYGSIGSFPVKSLHRFYKADGNKYLLATGATFIKLGDDDAGTFTTIRDGLTSGLDWSWVTYKDNAIGCNGTDACQKYDGTTQTTADTDGSRTANILTAGLGAPYAELNTGTNLDASKWYQYKMMFTAGAVTYYSSAVSNPILTGASVYDISLTDIPLGPSGTTARSVYRTEGQATRAALSSATFKLVGAISNNTATTYNDTVADGSLTTTWSASGKVNLTPPVVKYIILHRKKLFGASTSTCKSCVYWSYSFKPDIFYTASDYELIRPDDGDQITFLQDQLGQLIIGKENTISNLDTQNAEDTKWKYYTLSFVGCPAPRSVAKSPLGIIYLGWDGLYIYNNQTSQMISDAITQEIRDVLLANLDEVFGVYFENVYQMAYTSEDSGASENDVVLLFDTIRDAYVVDDKSVNCFEVFGSGSDYGTLYSGSSITDGNVHAHEQSLSSLVLRYKSDLDAGSRDSVTIKGTENDPEIYLAWGITIDDSSMTGVTLGSVTYDSATMARDDTTGYWWSPAYQVSANSYDKIYWHETLGDTGNITFAFRSAATALAATDESLAWSGEYTDPSGSNVSALTTNDFLQLRAKLSTTNITYTPTLYTSDSYMVKLLYSRVGTSSESSILSRWRSGYLDFGVPTIPKRIWGIDIYYTSTAGTMTVGMANGEGDIEKTFTIDLSVDEDDDTEDQYFGNNNYRIYKWLPSLSEDAPIGRNWQFWVEEGGTEVWNVYKILVKYSRESYYDE